MRVHFCRSNKLGGYVIQAALFSRWNHVAIEIDGVVFDATFTHGVTCWPAVGFLDRYDEVETVQIQVPNEEAARAFLQAQLGKAYDWRALVALPFRGSWHDSDKWFCSELMADCLKAGGIGLLDTIFKGHRVTPRDGYIALKIINGKPIAQSDTVNSFNR